MVNIFPVFHTVDIKKKSTQDGWVHNFRKPEQNKMHSNTRLQYSLCLGYNIHDLTF